jgi:lysozyme
MTALVNFFQKFIQGSSVNSQIPVKSPKEQAINEAGIALIKHFEGCSLHAYLDSVKVETIGWGRIVYDNGRKVKLGDTCTQAEADQWLLEDIEKDGAHYVKAWVTAPLTSDQFSALVSFTYNRGAGRLKEKLVGLLNSGQAAQAAEALLSYDYAGTPPRVLPGLTRRRKAERELFLSGDWTKYKA